MTRESHFGPIVQAGAPDSAIIKTEARDTYDVKRCIRRGAESRDVAGVLRNLRLDECDRDHGLNARLSGANRRLRKIIGTAG